ncbi:Mov34/MPN/PAD-1 family protein [Paenibacillaceae bacterium WGS1546]|uniref:Mov34/MPN/PAD-1 family protein n=1 Tax=Cohnella sp. WGS1546 TaxID=3366810 RepID=UPI00372D1750
MEAPKSVMIEKKMEDELVDACRTRFPYESCGVIYGTRQGSALLADGFGLVANAAAEPAANFFFDPRDWVEIYFRAQKNQRSIVGLFHSHPNGAPLPSASDSRGFVPWETYWIVGFSAFGHDIAVYRRESANWIRLPAGRPGPLV